MYVSGSVFVLTSLQISGSVPVLFYNDMFISQWGSPWPDTMEKHNNEMAPFAV